MSETQERIARILLWSTALIWLPLVFVIYLLAGFVGLIASPRCSRQKAGYTCSHAEGRCDRSWKTN